MSVRTVRTGRRLDAPATGSRATTRLSHGAAGQRRGFVPGRYVACCVVVTIAWSIRAWLVIPALLGCLLVLGVIRGLAWAERVVSAWADRLFAAEDAAARAEGWEVTRRRWGCRTYRDPRIRATAEARAAGHAWWSEPDPAVGLPAGRSGWPR